MKLFAFKQVLLRPVDKIKHRIWFTGALTFKCITFSQHFRRYVFQANLPIATPTAGEYAGGTSTCGACGANVQEQLMLTACVTMVID